MYLKNTSAKDRIEEVYLFMDDSDYNNFALRRFYYWKEV